MAEDSFKKFKKRYDEGKVPTLAMPPVPGAPGVGVARTIGMAAARTGLRGLKEVYDKAQKNAARNTKRREAYAAKKEARAKEKFGPLVKRQENAPAVREVGRRDLVVTRNQKKDVQPYKEGSKAVVKREENLPATRGSDSRALTVARENKGNLAKPGNRTFGDKGSGSRLGTNLKRAGAAALVGGAAYGLYKGADKPKAERKEAPRDDRASSKSDKAAAFKAKQQGMKTPGSPTNPNKAVTKKTGDKSRLAKPEKKFTNFERMKQRQYEKEGFGGRSMTSSRAKERVKTERGFKFKDLFK